MPNTSVPAADLGLPKSETAPPTSRDGRNRAYEHVDDLRRLAHAAHLAARGMRCALVDRTVDEDDAAGLLELTWYVARLADDVFGILNDPEFEPQGLVPTTGGAQAV